MKVGTMNQRFRLENLTHLSRALDPAIPSNRLIMLGTVLAGVGVGVYGVLDGGAFIEASLQGLWAAGSVFLAWALGRELDPDANFSAYVAAVIALLAYGVMGSPLLLPILALMMLARITTRVVGVAALAADYGYVVMVAGVALRLGGGMVAWVVVVGLLYQAALNHYRRWALGWTGVALAMGVYALLLPTEREWNGLLTGAAVIGVGFVPALVYVSATAQSLDDRNHAPLNKSYLRAAQLMALGAAIIFGLWYGGAGVGYLTPLWSALAGVNLRWLRDQLG